MYQITLINKTSEIIEHPFISGYQNEVDEILDDHYYIFYGLDLVVDHYDINFDENKITEKIYWVSNKDELDDVIFMQIYKDKKSPIPLNIDTTLNDVYIFEYRDAVYILDNQDNYFYFNREISSKLGVNIVLNKSITYKDIKPKLSSLALIGDVYDYESYIRTVKRNDAEYNFLQFIKMIDTLGCYNLELLEIYNNILKIEDYLNAINFVDYIDLNRADEYGFEYNDLNFYYEHTGFKNRTGRIFQSSNNNFTIQNLTAIQRDVVFAPPGFSLIEIDFKAFEIFILLQLLGLEVDFKKDPHIETYQKLINLDLGDRVFERELGKKINYSLIYGSNAINLYNNIITDIKIRGKDLDKDKFIENANMQLLHLIEDLFDDLQDEFKEFGYITNYFGRIIKPEKEFALINYYIQSTAADLFNIKVIEVLELFKNSENKLLIQKFDSMLFCIKDKDISNGILKDIAKILGKKVGDLESRFGISYGKNWKNID